jgi:hypothetical protein
MVCGVDMTVREVLDIFIADYEVTFPLSCFLLHSTAPFERLGSVGKAVHTLWIHI